MQIKGKQLKDGSVYQEKLNVTTDSIVSVSSVTNAEYVNTNSVNRVEALNYSTLNLNMVANVATVGDLACNSQVIEFPISNIMVKVNNINVAVGTGLDCYFANDLSGTTIRTGGQAQKGDYLFWNSSRFNLDATDEIDFIYITASETLELSGGTTITIDPTYPTLNVKYIGTTGTTMTVIIDSVSFTVGNIAGQFVWDIGGANEHTFTYVGENLLLFINGSFYTIWYDGLGSLLFSLKKGDFTPIVQFNIKLNGVVYNIIEDSNNKCIVGGEFRIVNYTLTNGICRITQNCLFDPTFNVGSGFNNTIYSMIKDSNGKYVIGGDFTTYKGLTQNSICRLNQDGSLDTTFDVGIGFNNVVKCIIQDTNGKYVIGGNFQSYKGLIQQRICRLNQDGSLDTTFVVGSGFNAQINTIIQDTNGKYVISGSFVTYKGVSQNRIIRIDQNGTKDATFNIGTGFPSTIYTTMQDSNGKYVVSGTFTTYKGVSQIRICRLEQNGLLDTSFIVGTSFNTQINSIIQDTNGKYVIGGNFTTYKGLTQNYICRLEQNGDIDSTFVVGDKFNSGVQKIIQDTNGKYVISGYFNSSAIRICKLNQDGTFDPSFIITSDIHPIINTIIQSSNDTYILGGQLTDIPYGYSQFNISRLDSIGSVDSSFIIGYGFDSTITTIIQDLNGKYVIGGYFYSYNGLTQNRICRLNLDGTIDLSFVIDDGFDGAIYSLIQDTNGKYVIGGQFTTYKGLTQNKICRLNQDGSLDDTFVIENSFDIDVSVIIQDTTGKYIIGGYFTTYNDISQNHICRLNQNGSLDNTFNIGSGFDGNVNTIIQDLNGKYVIGGGFTTYKGLAQNYICRLNQDGSIDTTFDIGVGFNSSVISIIQDTNNKYIIGGDFYAYKGLTQNSICRLNQDGSLDNTFNVGSGFNGTINSIIQYSKNKYIIGGNFVEYNGLSHINCICLNQDGTSNSI